MVKLAFMILLIFLVENDILSQTWSEPVIVYNKGFNNHPDFVIDKLGIIHCVWSHRITKEFRKIFYSKSTDQGNTWTSPIDISKNTDKWLDEPHIVSDSNNNLHVVYDYDLMDYVQTRICYINFDGTSWSEPEFLADEMPGSSHNRLIVDHNNKLYCFWYRGVIFYRCLENGTWSEIFLPYSPPSGEKYGLIKAIVDNQNDLHCIGSHHYDGQTPYDDRVIYFTMTSGHWNDLMEISDNRSWWGCDLSLNSVGVPAFTWGQLRNDTTANQVGTFYSRYTPLGLTDSIMLARDATDQAIAMDGNDTVHIVLNEKISINKFYLVYHQKDGNWNKSVLDSNAFPYVQNVLHQYKSKIYWVLNRLDADDGGLNPISSILFFKRDIPFSLAEDLPKPKLNIYPNPFTERIYIEIKSCNNPAIISIYNSDGQIVFSQKIHKLYSPKNWIYWDGCDKSGNPLPSGLYFVTLQSEIFSITRPIVYSRRYNGTK